ncbi:MAG: TetR/AcrR family transcriptional regulator [Bacillota bacterium]|nr:TetR/AcrR family transcriptional regulator [Bacillota bacterium]
MADKPYHHGNLRNQLIESGIELINEEGLKGFSLRKVAAKCGVSNAAPYSHFTSIDDLIGAMGEHVTEHFMEKLHTAIDGCENNPAAIVLLGNAYIDFFIENPQYFQFLFHHSGLTIDLDRESPNDYPPFSLFRTTAYRLFSSKKLPEKEYPERLAALWSIVHGIASLLSVPGIKYSGDWHEVFTRIAFKEENQ